MSLALRIDSIKSNPGSVEVFYTFGTVPLPVEPSGQGVSFANRQDAVAVKNDVVNRFNATFMLNAALAIYAIAASDPGLTNAVSGLTGKTLTLDVTKPAGVLSYG